MYVVQPIDEDVRAAMGDSVFSATPTFVFESAMPVPYISEQMGMSMESGVATPRVKAGEILATSAGDFVAVEYTTVVNGEVVVQTVVQTDVGAGAEQLQVVAETAPDDFVALPEAPFYSESAISTNPYESQAIEYYVHPEVPQADSVDFTVGAGAPVYVDGYGYVASGTASATADLLGYGETDVAGNPVSTQQATDPTNYNAQYDGV